MKPKTKTERKKGAAVRVQRMVRRWQRVTKALPPVNEKFGESEMLLCIEDDCFVPFVGWYNAKMDAWMVAHHSAPNIPRRVTLWMPLPPSPNDPDQRPGAKG